MTTGNVPGVATTLLVLTRLTSRVEMTNCCHSVVLLHSSLVINVMHTNTHNLIS